MQNKQKQHRSSNGPDGVLCLHFHVRMAKGESADKEVNRRAQMNHASVSGLLADIKPACAPLRAKNGAQNRCFTGTGKDRCQMKKA